MQCKETRAVCGKAEDESDGEYREIEREGETKGRGAGEEENEREGARK